MIQSHTTDTEVRNIIITGAAALIEQGTREMLIHNIFIVLRERFSLEDFEGSRINIFQS